MYILGNYFDTSMPKGWVLFSHPYAWMLVTDVADPLTVATRKYLCSAWLHPDMTLPLNFPLFPADMIVCLKCADSQLDGVVPSIGISRLNGPQMEISVTDFRAFVACLYTTSVACLPLLASKYIARLTLVTL